MDLKSLVNSIKNFEGITRKNLIKDVTGLLEDTYNIAGRTILGFGDDASALEIDNGQVVLLAADGMWGKLMEADPWWAGYCSVLVNVNDIAAMGGIPIGMTNVISTQDKEICAQIMDGINEGVKKVICLSTDKAAYPINAMGISKAMMEKVLVAKSKTVSPDRTTICGTRYGNVMASRGSVIPLFVEQIKSGQALTITDPDMTRFLMSLEEAVELVVFAFANAQAGDIMVQKSPASTIGDLAQALLELFDVDNEIRIIGTRHGEKLYETLLTKEEYIKAEDMGGFFRVPADKRDLNYDKYFVEGDVCLSTSEEYNSHNTYRLNVEEIKDKLLQLDYINNELSNWKKTGK